MAQVSHSKTARLVTVNGYRPGGRVADGGPADPYLPDGWKPYVYRGSNFEKPPVKHGTIEGAENHIKEQSRMCARCRKAVREQNQEAKVQE